MDVFYLIKVYTNILNRRIMGGIVMHNYDQYWLESQKNNESSSKKKVVVVKKTTAKTTTSNKKKYKCILKKKDV